KGLTVSRLRLMARLAGMAMVTFLLGSLTPALADLPQIEPPSSGGGGGLFGQIKGYFQDGIVLIGLVIAAAAFVKVAEAAVTTFSEVRDGKTGWGQFGAIIVVGVVLLVAVIWLLGKSASSSCKQQWELVMETIRFLPDRLNAEPTVFRGFTTPELGLAALTGFFTGLLWSLPFVPVFGWVIIPTGALLTPLVLVWTGGAWISRLKRGKPD
ncbi:TIGR03745 family integrating conjugative element membrane protein, partial [Pseudomonas aeruginosa]